ncbi:hypothetical protein J7M23_09580 [Candidatus Sumerlaeota bacterium]|nr:hypothetical protein [Candidatus Sumerlaeota bacterium]
MEGNAVLRWFVRGDKAVIESLKKIRSEATYFNRIKLGARLQQGFMILRFKMGRLKMELKNLGMRFGKFGTRIAPIVSVLSSRFGLLGRNLVHITNIATSVGKNTFRILMRIAGVLSGIISTFLKLGMVIKGVTLAGIGMLVKETIRANDKFQVSFARMEALLGKEKADKLIRWLEKRAVTLPETLSSLIETFSAVATTPLREFFFTGKKLNKEVVEKLAMLPAQVRLIDVRTYAQLPMVLSDLLKGGADSVRTFEMRFNTAVSTAAERIGVTEKEFAETLKKGGLEAFLIVSRYLETVVPSSAMAKMAQTVKVQVANLFDTIRIFLIKVTRMGFFKNLIQDLKDLNEFIRKILDTDFAKTYFGKTVNEFLDNIRKKIMQYLGFLFTGTSMSKSAEENLKIIIKNLVNLLGNVIAKAIMLGIKMAMPFIVAIIKGIIAELKPGGEGFTEAFYSALVNEEEKKAFARNVKKTLHYYHLSDKKLGELYVMARRGVPKEELMKHGVLAWYKLAPARKEFQERIVDMAIEQARRKTSLPQLAGITEFKSLLNIPNILSDVATELKLYSKGIKAMSGKPETKEIKVTVSAKETEVPVKLNINNGEAEAKLNPFEVMVLPID